MLFNSLVDLYAVSCIICQKIDYLTKPQCQDNDIALQEAKLLIFAT